MTTTTKMFPNLTNDSLVVAGAGADGHGVMAGCRGDGSMTRTQLVAYARQAGIPDECLPAPKDADVQLARAVGSVAGGTYDAKRIRKCDQTVAEARDWSARWALVSSTTTAISAGDKFGDVALVVTLYTDKPEPELVFDCDNDALVDAVRADYDKRIGAAAYVAADITKWLADLYRYHMGAVRCGLGWYVPRASRSIAESIEQVFNREANWGKDWVSPPLPVATSAQLARGIANGLIDEVGEVMGELITARERARAKKPNGDIGTRAAETFMIRFTRIGARVVSYVGLLDRESLASCHEAIHDAMVTLDTILDGGVDETFNGIWTKAATESAAMIDSTSDARRAARTDAKVEAKKPRAARADSQRKQRIARIDA